MPGMRALRAGPPPAFSIGLALALRLAALAVASPDPERFLTVDGREYLALARDPVAGYFDAASPLFPVGLFRTPLYPVSAAVVLRLGAGHVAAIVAAQVVLGTLTVPLVGRLGRRLAGEAPGRWAAFAFAADPVPILYGTVLQPETLFTALLVAAALAWMRALDGGRAVPAAATGALIGLAVLTRPIGVLLPFALGPLVLVGPVARRARVLLTMIATSGLVVGGWIAHNWALTGTPLLTTVSSINLLDYRAAGALARAEGTTWDDARRRLAAQVVARAGDAGSLDRARSAVARRVLWEHPWATAADVGEGFVRMFVGSGLTAFSALVGDPDPETLARWWKYPVLAVLLLWMAGFYTAALLGLRTLLARRARRETALVGAFVLALTVPAAGPSASTRFRAPLVPFLAVLAGAAARDRAEDPGGL